MEQIAPLPLLGKAADFMAVDVPSDSTSTLNPRDQLLFPTALFESSTPLSQISSSSVGMMMDLDLDESSEEDKSLKSPHGCSFHVEEDIMLEDEHDHSYSTDELDHGDDNMSISSGCHDESMAIGEGESNWSFWLLPPEIRELVYRELLLSDSAFRLGHHGPYSHETRKPTYPAILRTCRVVFEEASAVLYGDNTFYLGPIGHKPTYSASFLTSIGQHNALKIRTLAAHSTNPSAQLSERSLRNWISSFGLDVMRIKILALSFSNLEDKKRPLLSQQHQHQQQQHQHQHQQLHNVQQGQILPNQIIGTHHHHHQLSLTGATLHTQQGFGNLSTVVIPHGAGSSLGLPTVPVPLALLLSSNATGSTTPIATPTSDPNSNQNSNALHMMGFGAPLQRFGNSRYQQHNQHAPTLVTVSSNSPSLSPTSTSMDLDCDDQLSIIVARLGGWLEVAREEEVSQWIVLKNTDLRAGENWLLHVSRAARRVRALA